MNDKHQAIIPADKATTTSFNSAVIPVIGKDSALSAGIVAAEIHPTAEISPAKKAQITIESELTLASSVITSNSIELAPEEGYAVTIKAEKEIARGCINVGIFSPKKAAILGEGEDFYASEIRLGDTNIVPSEGNLLHIFTTSLRTDAHHASEAEAAGGGGAVPSESIIGATAEEGTI